MSSSTDDLRPLDEQAFGARVEPHRRELHLHCYRLLGSFEEAEDLVQEAFLRARRRRETYEGRASVRAWLYRIATNACLDALDKRPRRPGVSGEVAWLQPYPDELLEQLPDRREGPEDVALAKETVELRSTQRDSPSSRAQWFWLPLVPRWRRDRAQLSPLVLNRPLRHPGAREVQTSGLPPDPWVATLRVARRTYFGSVNRRATPLVMRGRGRWGHRGATRDERSERPGGTFGAGPSGDRGSRDDGELEHPTPCAPPETHASGRDRVPRGFPRAGEQRVRSVPARIPSTPLVPLTNTQLRRAPQAHTRARQASQAGARDPAWVGGGHPGGGGRERWRRVGNSPLTDRRFFRASRELPGRTFFLGFRAKRPAPAFWSPRKAARSEIFRFG